MPIQRLTGVAALVSMLLFAIPAHAETRAVANLSLIAGATSAYSLSLNQLPILNPAPMFAATPAFGAAHSSLLAPVVAKADDAKPAASATDDQADSPAETITDLRKALI